MNKANVFAFSIAAVLVAGSFLLGTDSLKLGKNVTELTINTASAAHFEELSNQTTNSCGGGKSAVYGLPESGRMQGSCCGAMDRHSYEEQLVGLKKYAEYESIPVNPYDVPVEWAKATIEYSEQAQLSPEQQTVYDEAMEMSEEGGPCCCVCWHWYAYEGLAKQLIINENFTAEQIAEVWELSDACGGESEHKHE